MHQELPSVQTGFRKGRRTRDQTANFQWIIAKARELKKKKKTISASLTMLKPLCALQQTLANSCKNGNTRPPYLPPEKQEVKKQQLEPDMEQQTDSKLGKEYIKAVYCHPAYLNYMQSTSCEMLGWMNHKLESRFPGEIPTMSHMQMIPL